MVRCNRCPFGQRLPVYLLWGRVRTCLSLYVIEILVLDVINYLINNVEVPDGSEKLSDQAKTPTSQPSINVQHSSCEYMVFDFGLVGRHNASPRWDGKHNMIVIRVDLLDRQWANAGTTSHDPLIFQATPSLPWAAPLYRLISEVGRL